MTESLESSHHQKEGVGVESRVWQPNQPSIAVFVVSPLDLWLIFQEKAPDEVYSYQELDGGPIGPRSRVCIE